MGLRGDHLVTLLIHCNAGPCRSDIRIRGSCLAEEPKGILLILLLVCVTLGLPGLASASVSTPADELVPLLQTHFSEPPDAELWQGDLTWFRAEPGFEPGMLRLDAPSDPGRAYLSTRNPYSAVHWEWYLRQSFAPSNNNRAFVFLNEASGRLDDEPTGLAIRTGENGTPKHFRLLHYDKGASIAEWIQSDIAIQADTGYRIRVLLSPDRQLHLYIAEGRNRVPLLQTETALLPESMDPGGHFGFLTRYTATRSDQFYFSDVWIADALPPPRIADFAMSSGEELSDPYGHPWQYDGSGTIITVTFEVPPDPDDIGVQLFRLEDGTRPDEVHCGHPQICSIRFSQPLPSGEHRLVTDAYSTIYGQRSHREAHSFLVSAAAGPGDVIINEFMYRPPASMPAYVELFNRSDKVLNLRNWRLQRRAVSTEPVRKITTQDLFLHPGDFLVLTADASLLQRVPGAEQVMEMESFPRFNIASSDEIRLFSNTDEVIDSLQYQPFNWGGFEVALERKSPDVPGWIPENWAESLSEHGGTPGHANSVRPPVTPPELLSVDYSQPAALTLTFSRLLDPSSLTYPGAIRLLDTGDTYTRAHAKTGLETFREIAVSVVKTGGNSVSVIPGEQLQHGVLYVLIISDIRDLFGNPIGETEKAFRYYETGLPEAGDIIINEVLYRPGPDNPRFIEILNRSEKVFDLRNWKIGRSLGSAVSIADPESDDPVFLIPNELAVVSEPGLTVKNKEILHFEIPAFPSLSRFGDSIYLIRENYPATDSLTYLPAWGGNRDGISLERVDPDGATNDPSNWREHPDGHTAGMWNHHFESRPEPVILLRAAQIDEIHVELSFSRFVSLSSLDEVTLGGTPLQPAISYIKDKSGPANNYGSVFLFRSSEPIKRQFQMVRIASVTDYAGRPAVGLTSPLTFLPEPGDMVINEVMYQPIAARYSTRPDQSEYVEVYNRSGLPLQMDNVYLHDRPDKEGLVRKLLPAGNDLVTLMPEQYAVIFADTSHLFRETRLSRAFPLSDTGQALFLRVDRQTLGLSTQGDQVYVSHGGRVILDSLWYLPSWHNPNLLDVRGISLERIDFDLPTGDRTNWTSSTSPDGGTPASPNSVVAPPGSGIEGNRDTGLVLAPNPFSPNRDGTDDHLVIHYRLDGPDYLIHARVFDRQGRHVRTLADGMLSGRTGKLIWDGRTDRGIMNRAGIYIIHLEAYNRSEGRRKTYRAVAVLAVHL
ncbi:MAG: hypothetical protein EA363_02045 [Balneolaceae bacterium]|nr:MAG: hypothetical protein EA363_02045 [Balneolaceae bacterium]